MLSVFAVRGCPSLGMQKKKMKFRVHAHALTEPLQVNVNANTLLGARQLVVRAFNEHWAVEHATPFTTLQLHEHLVDPLDVECTVADAANSEEVVNAFANCEELHRST